MTSPTSSATPLVEPLTTSSRQRACRRCSRLKVKCTWDSSPSCQRCQRSNLECVVPECQPKKKRGKSNRVRELEQKIDNILSLLDTNQQIPTTDLGRVQATQGRNTPQDACCEGSSESTPTRTIAFQPLRPISLPIHPTEQGVPLNGTLFITLEEADRILEHFRTEKLPNFPFMDISGFQAQDMVQNSPLLLRAILYSCRAPSWPISEMENLFRQSIAMRIVVQHGKTVDLLQAILAFVAWSGWQACVQAHDTSLLHLACGIVGDLGLNRSSNNQVVPLAMGAIYNQAPQKISGLNKPQEHTNADKRAFLGVFYLTSVVWSYLRRSEPLWCLERVEECCADLIKADETQSDMILVMLARMQGLMVKISRSFPMPSDRGRASPCVPLSMLFDIIQKQLEGIMQQIPLLIKSRPLIQSHYYAVLQRLYEPVVYTAALEANIQPIQRTQALWACCQNAKSVVELWLSVHPHDLSAMPSAFFAHFSFANLALVHILFLQDPDWDASAARESIDYAGLLQRVMERLATFEALEDSRPIFLEGSSKLIPKLMERLRWLKDWYTSRHITDLGMLGSATGPSGPPIFLDEETMSMLFTWDDQVSF